MKNLKEVLKEAAYRSKYGGNLTGSGRANYHDKKTFKQKELDFELGHETKGGKPAASKRTGDEVKWTPEWQKEFDAEMKKRDAADKKKREKEIISVYGSMENYKKTMQQFKNNVKKNKR